MNMVPGGPFLSEKAKSEETTAALEAKYGLDKPLHMRYFNYMRDALKGDFGPSIKQRGRTVSQIINEKFPVSASVGGIAALVSLFVGIPLGSIAALKRGKAADNAILVGATFGISIPSFVIATTLLFTFKWIPTLGSSWIHYIKPVLALALYPTAYIARLMRSSMLDVIGQDYILTAKAKGVSQSVMLFKHALRNAILPIITYLGPMLAYMLTGSFVVERILSVPGLGNEFISSILNRDYTMIMGTTIFLAALLILLNAVVDILYTFVDPRIKLK